MAPSPATIIMVESAARNVNCQIVAALLHPWETHMYMYLGQTYTTKIIISIYWVL